MIGGGAMVAINSLRSSGEKSDGSDSAVSIGGDDISLIIDSPKVSCLFIPFEYKEFIRDGNTFYELGTYEDESVIKDVLCGFFFKEIKKIPVTVSVFVPISKVIKKKLPSTANVVAMTIDHYNRRIIIIFV